MVVKIVMMITVIVVAVVMVMMMTMMVVVVTQEEEGVGTPIYKLYGYEQWLRGREVGKQFSLGYCIEIREFWSRIDYNFARADQLLEEFSYFLGTDAQRKTTQSLS